MADQPRPAYLDRRQVRVFISSTFRDFMEERDLLVKQIFPSLGRKAQERGVEVVDVDLRWGITEQECQQGKVIGICLAEIERCRPYFIGMLGERRCSSSGGRGISKLNSVDGDIRGRLAAEQRRAAWSTYGFHRRRCLR